MPKVTQIQGMPDAPGFRSVASEDVRDLLSSVKQLCLKYFPAIRKTRMKGLYSVFYIKLYALAIVISIYWSIIRIYTVHLIRQNNHSIK